MCEDNQRNTKYLRLHKYLLGIDFPHAGKLTVDIWAEHWHILWELYVSVFNLTLDFLKYSLLFFDTSFSLLYRIIPKYNKEKIVSSFLNLILLLRIIVFYLLQ